MGLFVEILAYTARGIATHHGFGAVGIEDAHGVVCFWDRTLVNEYQPVRTYAFVTVAPIFSSRRRVGYWVLHGVDIDIVVAASVHLGEWHYLHFVRYSFTFLAVSIPLAIARTTSEAPFWASPQTKTFSG